MAGVKPVLWNIVVFFLASPLTLCIAMRRLWRRLRFLSFAWRTQVVCECGEIVALLGQWKCSCGFTYRGHLVTVCRVCGSLPKVVRCYACGVTKRLPDP